MMSGYFRPWKRRFGVVALFIASVFTAGWIGSFRMEDRFDVYAGTFSIGKKSYYGLWSGVSANGSMYLGRIWGQPEEATDIIAVESYYRYPRWHRSLDVDFPSDELRYLWRFCGFGIYERGRDDAHNGGWRVVIPYWSVVGAMIALSAYLLFNKLSGLAAKVPA